MGSNPWIQAFLAFARGNEALPTWDPALAWWLTDSLGPDVHILFLLLGRSPPCIGKTREPIGGCCNQVRLSDCSCQEGLYLKLSFKLIIGYGEWWDQWGYCSECSGLLFIILGISSLLDSINEWLGWLLVFSFLLWSSAEPLWPHLVQKAALTTCCKIV